MRPTRLVGTIAIGCATITMLLMMPGGAVAQEVTGSALKAAFIYNFVRFTEWPEAFPASEPFVMCVVGDNAVREALERTVKGREFADHPIVVTTAAGPKRPCHVLYVSGVIRSEAAQLVAGLRDAPVLTVSDIEGFSGVGGIAELFFQQGQLRFTIRPESAKRAGLRISSRLLSLSKRNE